jgi:hypothetical protein
MLVILGSAVLFSCAGAKSELSAGAGPFAGLPSIPLDVPGHDVSDVHNASINGVDTFLRSPGAITQGNNLQLFTVASNPPVLEWGVYRYVPDSGQDEVVSKVTFNFTVNAGPNGWIGIANYKTGMWEFKGPYNDQGGGGSKILDNLDAVDKDYTSPGGNLYFLAAAYNGSTVTVNGLSIVSDVTQAATYSISGQVTDATSGNPLVDVVVRIASPSLQTNTDVNGNYTFSGLAAGSYTVSADTYPGYQPFGPATHQVTVPPSATAQNFEADLTGPPDVTYETGAAIMKDKIDTYCIRCHEPGGEASFWPLRTYAEIQAVGFANVWSRVDGPLKPNMPQTGSPEAAAINAAGDRHWFTDWKNNTPTFKQ